MPSSRGSSQGSNPGLPHCRRILYRLSPQGSPVISRRDVEATLLTVSVQTRSPVLSASNARSLFQKLASRSTTHFLGTECA